VGKSVEALVKGSLLEWARHSAKISLADAADKLGVDQATLLAWETNDESKPTLAKLRDMARFYKRPLAVFYLDAPPKGFDVLRDFRMLDPDKPQITTALEFALREASARREQAVDLARLLGVDVPEFGITATLDDHPDVLAERVRARLGLSINQQLAWKTDSEAVAAWRKTLEAAGVLVFRAGDLPWDDARGFSIWGPVYPAVAFNSQEDTAPRIFTMMHEVMHIALRAGGIGICNLDDDGLGVGPRTEAFCNRVAGAVLVPREVLLNERDVVRHFGMTWHEEELRALARRFHVSAEVIARRLVIVGKASKEFYNQRRARMKALYEGRRPKPKPGKSGGVEMPADRVVRESGFTFTRLVLNAYEERRITASEVADAFDVRLKHLEAISREVKGAA
jgi:Zn-dependent peptidase ImmA (M78 family)/transcriptional regulator with XRE-family HTH domain